MNLESVVRAVRGLVRPLVTYAVMAAQIAFIGAGAASGDFEAAKMMQALTGVVVGFWFLERAVSRASGRAP